MKITRIIAAAAAPLALGGVLLATAGQASAAVAAPAVLTASVQQQTVSAVIHQANAEDTTSGGTATSYTDPVYGPVWAYDNQSKEFDVTQTGPGPTRSWRRCTAASPRSPRPTPASRTTRRSA